MSPATTITTGKGTANSARAEKEATARAMSARVGERTAAHPSDRLGDEGDYGRGEPGEQPGHGGRRTEDDVQRGQR